MMGGVFVGRTKRSSETDTSPLSAPRLVGRLSDLNHYPDFMWRNGLITVAIFLLLLCSLAVLAFGVLASQVAGTNPIGEGVFWATIFIALSLYSLLAVVCLGDVIREAWHSRDIRRGRMWPVLIRMTTPKWMLLRPWVWFLIAVPLLLETLQHQAWRQEAQTAQKR